MFRRARLTVRPNVRPLGRAAATGSGGVDPERPEPPGSDTPASDRAGTAAGSADARRAESDDKVENTSYSGEASKPAEMLTQRRKRISTVPNLVKPRTGPLSAPKPQRRTSQTSDGSASPQKDPSPSEKSNVESSVKSPMLPEKKTPVPQVPQFSPLKKSVNKEQTVGVAAPKNDDSLLKNVPSPLKERPTQERSCTQEEKLPVKPSPEKVKRMCSDRERILKARKLREMLKEELKKERMKLKHRPPIIEGRSPPDRSKMTMRDLIYYLPENNPMKSSLIEEKRTEKSSALSQMKEQEEKSTPDHEEEEEEENGEESQDGPLLVPRVKVAEDGSIILDEESLTVEVLRTKGPCVVEENDPIFERGSTTTYSSFRKSFYTKPWSNKETDMFFLAISMVGTDFSLIGRLFPHRARAEIKNKFKREEKANAWRIDKAFKEKRPFDFEFFAQLLEKVLADEEKRKQKTVKNLRPKEKKSPRPQKKLKAKAASTEAANNQDELQEAGISDAETEADGVTAEKENEGSLGISEQAEEQLALEPALAKKKRKKKRKDDLEQEVENIPEEMPVPSKTAEEGKSSNKRKKLIHDASSDGHTFCGEEMDCAIEGTQNETAVTEEETSESCSPVNNQMQREGDVNLCSLEDSNDVILEAEPAKLRTRDIRDDTSQESQIPELPVSNIGNKEAQSVETTETKNEDTHDLQKTDGKQSASESGSQSEIMRTEKSAERRRLQRPKPNLVRSSGRREMATQDKMEAKISPTLANAGEKCCEEDSRRNRNEAAEVENRGLGTASQESEKTAVSKTIVRGYRQRFKPNVTRASGRKEEPEKDAGNEKISHLQPKGETEKNNDQSNRSDVTSEDAAEKNDEVLETMSQSNATAGLKDGKRIMLNQVPLKRGRIQRPKPNLGRTVARQKEQIDEKNPEEETAEGGEAEKGVIHHRDENNDPCLKSDLTVHEDTQPSSVTLEDASIDSETNSICTRQCFQEQSSEAESYENEKGLSDVLKQVSDSNTGECHPQKEEEKIVSSRLLRRRFQRPKPNLRTTSRKEVLDVNSKGASQKDTSKEENLAQCDSECSIPPDTDKAGKCEVLNALESLGKEKSLCSQEVSERPSCESPKTFSRSEDGEREFCLPEISQDDISTTVTGTQEHQQALLPPIQLARNKRYKPNLVRTFGKKGLQISENERKKKPEAEQKDQFDDTVMGENEAVLCQADVLKKEEQEQQGEPQVLSISETLLPEQSTEKITSQEGKMSALKPGQFIRIESPRTGPNLERTYSEKGCPIVKKLAAPDEEGMNQGENLLVAEESENLLSSKNDVEVLLVGNLAKIDSLDVNSRSMTSGMLCSSKKPPNCNSKRELEECQSADALGSIQDTTERSNGKLNFGEGSELRAMESNCNPRPDPMRLTRKRDYPEECENREEDNTERDEEDCLVLLKTGVSGQNFCNTVEARSFSEPTRKYNFSENVEGISCKRIRQDITLQSPGRSSESQAEQDNDSQPSTSQEKYSDNLTRRQFRRSSKQTVLPEHVLEPKTATSSASECEADSSERGSQRQEAKLTVTRDKSLKTTQRRKSVKEPRSSKITLITLRASQEEEDEEPDDFELDDEEECFASEEINKAPVFVPIGLRSPKPVLVKIQETMEELEIPVNNPHMQVAADAEGLSCASIQPLLQREETVNTSTAEAAIHENPNVDKGINDGSTEAAMTLLAMGDPNFQLKTGTEEQTHMAPAQNDLDMADSHVVHAYSKENRTSSQYSLASDTSVKELLPSEDGSNINVEHQVTGTRIGVEEYSEMDAPDTSGSSLPVVNSMRLTGGRHLEPEPTSGIAGSNENIMQEILNANLLVEQLEQIQTDLTTLSGNAEMQKVEPQPIRPAADDSSVFHDFATGSMEFTKQVDKTERTEKQIRDACGNSGDLRHLTASPKPEKSYLGLEDCPSPSSVGELSEQIPCPLERHIGTVSFTQNEACNQDAPQHCVSSTEETSEKNIVVNDDHRCPEEEQTFILTLVEIPADSKEFDASAMAEQTSEPLLPAPILISSVNASETTVTEVESTGSLTAASGEVAAPLNSNMETKQLATAVDSVPKLQTAQKRLAAELDENDFPPSKKTPVAVEDNLEATYKGYSIKSTDVPLVTSGNPFQKTESSAKEEVLTSVLVSDSISQLAERSQLETLESLGKAPIENPAPKKEEEVMSRLTSNRKAEISGQEKQENVHESAELEHTGNSASSSKTPLLRGGRKPLGFLSLICKKSNSESAEDTKGKRGKMQKPLIVTPKRSLKKPAPSTKDDRESCFFPTTSSSVEHEHVAADAAVTVLSNNSSEKRPLCAKDHEKEGEPTKISEYFFSDIFMEVDDSE